MAAANSGPKHRPRKRFGQNFLIDRHIINDIVSAIGINPADRIVEIGPGLGALTEALLADCQHLTVVEIDRDLADILTRRHTTKPNFTLHIGDALKTDFAELSAHQPIRLVGNLPYNISTPLLFHLLSYRHLITDMFFMLQKEVVDRLAASPGNKSYGRLSVMMQYHCQVQPLFSVPPSAFKPAPKVTSAVIRLIPHRNPAHKVNNIEIFERLVKTCFQQRRKTLRNSVKVLAGDNIEAINTTIDLSARPEMLSVEEFVALSNQLAQHVLPTT